MNWTSLNWQDRQESDTQRITDMISCFKKDMLVISGLSDTEILASIQLWLPPSFAVIQPVWIDAAAS